MVGHPKRFSWFDSTTLPVDWLRIKIVRGCSEDAGRLFELIEFARVLGPFKYACFGESRKPNTKVIWRCNPMTGSSVSETIATDFFGGWLPHNLGTNVSAYL